MRSEFPAWTRSLSALEQSDGSGSLQWQGGSEQSAHVDLTINAELWFLWFFAHFLNWAVCAVANHIDSKECVPPQLSKSPK